MIDSGSTNTLIDQIFDSCDDLLAGKMICGAGGGGFFLFYVQPEKQVAVKEAMKDLLYVPFGFEDGGTRVIHYTPESYIPKEEEE